MHFDLNRLYKTHSVNCT